TTTQTTDRFFTSKSLNQNCMERLDLYYDRINGNVYYEGLASEIPDRISQPLLQRRVETLIGRKGLKASYATGKGYMKPLLRTLHQKNKKEGLDLMLKHLSTRGFGSLKRTELKKDHMNIQVNNCFNALPNPKSDKKSCFEMAGILAACGEVLMGEGMDCMETACISQGDPYCEFHIFKHGLKTKEKKDSVLESLPSQENDLVKHNAFHDPHKGETIFEDNPSLILPQGYMAQYQREIELLLGEKPTKKMEYLLTKKSSIITANTIKNKKLAGYFHSPANLLLREMVKQAQRRGFGIPIIQEFYLGKPYLRLIVKNSFNAHGYSKARNPVCYRMAALCAGFGTALFNKDMDCIETKCSATGDPCCEFRVYANPHRRTQSGRSQKRSIQEMANLASL
ncbi:MAG: 4-vinyl reductase, partial [Candidatus Altiarchaeota archaeon]|nr:4-vinyl reductase [Candidatus Altiarchaeota archaeon]